MEQIAGYTEELLPGGTRVYVTAEHRFGTDAMLLSHFSAPKRGETVCDLGTGCGIIPLRWFDGGHRGRCDGVELSPQGALLLKAAACRAKADNITAHCADLRSYNPGIGYDLVACNPPYFNGGLVSPSPHRAMARHQISCTTDDLAAAGRRLLKTGGRLCLCQRPQELARVICALSAAGIEPKRLQMVRRRPDTVPWLFLLDARRGARPGLVLLADIVIEDKDGGFSRQLLEIYGKLQAGSRPGAQGPGADGLSHKREERCP